MRFTVLIFLLMIIISCGAFRQIEQTDSIGRVVKVAHYDGSKLKYLEEIRYSGNTYNPVEIIYYNRQPSELKPFKKEIFTYVRNSISAISVYSYEGKSTKLINQIKFIFTDESRIKSIEYYSYTPSSGLYLFGLDQYKYEAGNPAFRRIIEYQMNTDTGRAIQKAQYQIFYKEGIAFNMKSGVIDSGSSSIIENSDDEPEVIEKKVVSIEKYFLMKTLGRETILKSGGS